MEDFENINELIQLFADRDLKVSSQNAKDFGKSHPLMLDEIFSGDIIFDKKLTGNSLSSKKVSVIKFYNCQFENCDLTSAFFWMCTFQKCTFKNCVLESVVFRKCEIDACRFVKCSSRFYQNISESYLYHTKFDDCTYQGLEISGTDTYDLKFNKCLLSMGRFQANFTYRYNLSVLPDKYLDSEDKKLLKLKGSLNDVEYNECVIDFFDFRMLNLVDTIFRNCQIAKSSFTDCCLYDYNFDLSNNKQGWGTNHVDLTTLLESQKISPETLKLIFNIDGKVQIEIKQVLAKKNLSSVFISYSLKDKKIANAINDFLQKNGVTTFLWERDAPGGINLKHIMKSSIDAKDRVLFVASENSLKSEACHFELSQGRKKQAELWRTILFPIHIDNFLFDVQLEQVRPKEKRTEYWQNIEELRDINSLDFTKFKNGVKGNSKAFNASMTELLEALKIE